VDKIVHVFEASPRWKREGERLHTTKQYTIHASRLTALATLAHARARHTRASHLHLQQYFGSFGYMMSGLGS
jgi:hypothetical protein